MRRSIFVLTLFAASVVFVGLSSVATKAQGSQCIIDGTCDEVTTPRAQTGPRRVIRSGEAQNVFSSEDECREAASNNLFSVYHPIYTTKKYRVAGLSTYSLPELACVQQDVAGGVGPTNAKWTVQDSSVRFANKGDKIYNAACGNEVYRIVLLKKKAIALPPEQPLPPAQPKCANSSLTIAQAKEIGLIVTDDGRCIQPAPPEPKCANSNLTIAQARELGLTVTDDGRCVVPQAPAPPPCPTCPKLGAVANKEGVFNKKQALLSGIFGGVPSAAGSTGGLKRRAAIGGGAAGLSILANIAARAPESSRGDKSFTFTAQMPEQQPFTFTLKKGESYNQNGINLQWVSDRWVLNNPDCYGMFVPKETFIFTPIPVILREKTKVITTPPTTTTAVKDESTPPVRTGSSSTGQNGQIPGGVVQPTYAPGTTVPTRPTRANTGNALTNNTATATSSQQAGGYVQAQTASGRTVLVRRP